MKWKLVSKLPQHCYDQEGTCYACCSLHQQKECLVPGLLIPTKQEMNGAAEKSFTTELATEVTEAYPLTSAFWNSCSCI